MSRLFPDNTTDRSLQSGKHILSFFTRVSGLFLALVMLYSFSSCGQSYSEGSAASKDTTDQDPAVALQEAPKVVALDTAAYDAKMQQITNGDSSGLWPVKAPYPLPGAILPFKRVVSYYGNL